MTIRNRPDYGVFNILMTAAGTLDIPALGTRVVLAGCYEGASLVSINGGFQELQGGAPVAGQLAVQIGKTPGDPIPFSVGTAVRVANKFDFVRLSWGAQPGIYASVIVSDDADGNGVEATAPPTVVASDATIVEGGNTARVEAAGGLDVTIIDQNGHAAFTSGDGWLSVRLVAGLYGAGSFLTNPGSNALPLDGAGAPIQAGEIGTSFYAGVTIPTGATTIIAPGLNVHGVVIRTATLEGANIVGVLCAGTAAPTSQTSNPPLFSNGGATALLPAGIFLPAGQGLYVYNPSASNMAAFMTYDIR
ncbi:MAG TPA: hypothetical protein VMU87_01355 [Stellaceae bacterium]|nr:hypothetical protein [Stellaceae bacterium]